MLSPALLISMALMALAITFMTSPMLEWIYFSHIVPKEYESRHDEGQEEATTFSVVD